MWARSIWKQDRNLLSPTEEDVIVGDGGVEVQNLNEDETTEYLDKYFELMGRRGDEIFERETGQNIHDVRRSEGIRAFDLLSSSDNKWERLSRELYDWLENAALTSLQLESKSRSMTLPERRRRLLELIDQAAAGYRPQGRKYGPLKPEDPKLRRWLCRACTIVFRGERVSVCKYCGGPTIQRHDGRIGL